MGGKNGLSGVGIFLNHKESYIFYKKLLFYFFIKSAEIATFQAFNFHHFFRGSALDAPTSGGRNIKVWLRVLEKVNLALNIIGSTNL